MIFGLSGHIGDNAAALVDDQLSPELAERAWAHVLSCPGCREAVAYESWTKRKLSAISGQPSVLAPQPSNQLLNALHSVSGAAEETEPQIAFVRTRRGAMVMGTGALGMMVAGLMAVTASQPGPLPIQTSNTGSSLGTASLASGVLNVLGARPTRIGDDNGLPEADPGRAVQTIDWRLPN